MVAREISRASGQSAREIERDAINLPCVNTQAKAAASNAKRATILVAPVSHSAAVARDMDAWPSIDRRTLMLRPGVPRLGARLHPALSATRNGRHGLLQGKHLHARLNGVPQAFIYEWPAAGAAPTFFTV